MGSSNCLPHCEHNHKAIGLNELWAYSNSVRTSPTTLVDSSICVWMYISYTTCVEVGRWSSGLKEYILQLSPHEDQCHVHLDIY